MTSCSFSLCTFSRLASLHGQTSLWGAVPHDCPTQSVFLSHFSKCSVCCSLFSCSTPSVAHVCQPGSGLGTCVLLQGSQAASLLWEHQLIPGHVHHSTLTCCLLMRCLSLVVHPLQEMHHREQTLCLCRQVVSLFSPEGILHISPNSTLFLAFSNSQLLASNPLPSFWLFVVVFLFFSNFRKIITWAQRDAHCVYVFISVYIRELPFFVLTFISNQLSTTPFDSNCKKITV